MAILKKKNNGNTKAGKTGRIVFASICFILGIITIINSIAIIPAGHSGVRVTLGRVGGVESEGLTFKLPFVQRIVIMDNRTQALEMNTEAVTRDLQAVNMVYTVNYFLNADMTDNVFQTIGTGFESIIIRPTVEETVKDITARYTIEELITERARVSADIASALQATLSARGFTFERFNIVDFSFSSEFSNAIEQVRIAEQNALRAEQDLARVEFEAEADRAMARAQADVLRYQAQELTDTNLMAMWIERWNGILPQIMTGDGGGMLLNFDLATIEETPDRPQPTRPTTPTQPEAEDAQTNDEADE